MIRFCPQSNQMLFDNAQEARDFLSTTILPQKTKKRKMKKSTEVVGHIASPLTTTGNGTGKGGIMSQRWAEVATWMEQHPKSKQTKKQVFARLFKKKG